MAYTEKRPFRKSSALKTSGLILGFIGLALLATPFINKQIAEHERQAEETAERSRHFKEVMQDVRGSVDDLGSAIYKHDLTMAKLRVAYDQASLLACQEELAGVYEDILLYQRMVDQKLISSNEAKRRSVDQIKRTGLKCSPTN